MGTRTGARYVAGDTAALPLRTLGARYRGPKSYAPQGGRNEAVRVRLPCISVLGEDAELTDLITPAAWGNERRAGGAPKLL